MGVYTWCQETYSSNTSDRAIRGFNSARLWHYSTAMFSSPIVGFRPVLEILNTDPLISDSDRDLGDKNSNFTITYTVDDADSGDVLTATESLDGQTTKSFAPTRNSVNTISVDVDSLSPRSPVTGQRRWKNGMSTSTRRSLDSLKSWLRWNSPTRS